MAVENTILESPLYTGDGVTTQFNCEFDFLLSTDVAVHVRDTEEEELVNGVDYIVTKVDQTGYITLAAPLPLNNYLRIVSNIPAIQPYQFARGSRFPEDRIEGSLDRLTLVVQRVLNILGRTISAPITSSALNLTLPAGGSEQAGFVWRWTIPNGDALEAVSPLDVTFGSELSTDIRTFLGSSTTNGARNNLGLGSLATQSGTFSGTSSGTNTGDQNLFGTIKVAGQSDVVADAANDTLTLEAGSNVTITTNAATDTITISATGGGGGLSNVVDDLTPQLGGDLDLNGNQITSPDGTDQIDIPNGTIDLKTNSSSRADITDSGLRLGGANARVTTILDEDTMSSNSDTALATQQSIKAYVDSRVGSGKVLQVVDIIKTTSFSSATGSSWVDITGLSATITPSSSTSKIEVNFNCVVGSSGSTDLNLRVVRNSTPIFLGTPVSSSPGVTLFAPVQSSSYPSPVSFTGIDSPSTTSAITYKIQVMGGGTSYIGTGAAPASATHGVPVATIILKEIGA